jgi:CRP-like cAMP-binding protein
MALKAGRATVTDPLTRKLENFAVLSAEDRRFLAEIARPGHRLHARADIIREGDKPDDVHLVLEGFGCRYKILPDGKRHIMAYLVPGDLCDVHVFILKAMDHNIGTLSACRVVDIPRNKILEMLERPAVAQALWWSALVDEATLREWLVNIGRRPAEQRIAHLLCELLMRLQTVGLTNGNRYELPLTQADIAETMGLTLVHVNRVLQRLRRSGLITLANRQLVINDAQALKEFGEFNPNYLHLGTPPRRRSAARGRRGQASSQPRTAA